MVDTGSVLGRAWGRVGVEVGPNFAIGPNLADTGPKLRERASTVVEFGPTFGRLGPILVELGRIRSEIGPDLVDDGNFRVTICQNWPMSFATRSIRSEVVTAQIWSGPCHALPNLAEHGPNSVEFGSKLAKLIGRIRLGIGPSLADSGWSELSDELGLGLAEFGPASLQRTLGTTTEVGPTGSAEPPMVGSQGNV